MKSETKYLIYVLTVFGSGSILLQSLIAPLMQIHVWQPDFVLIIVLLTGKRFRSGWGSTAGFLLGIIQDSLTGMPVGITALPKTIAGYASGKTTSIYPEGTLYYVWFLFLLVDAVSL